MIPAEFDDWECSDGQHNVDSMRNGRRRKCRHPSDQCLSLYWLGPNSSLLHGRKYCRVQGLPERLFHIAVVNQALQLHNTDFTSKLQLITSLRTVKNLNIELIICWIKQQYMYKVEFIIQNGISWEKLVQRWMVKRDTLYQVANSYT